MTEPLKLLPGFLSCVRICRGLSRLLESFPQATISLIWCPSNSGLPGTVLADAAAKAATELPQIIDCPPCTTTFKKKIKDKLVDAANIAPTNQALTRMMGVFDPGGTFKALCKLSCPAATFITQLRAGHCPLNDYLFRFTKADTPNCALCTQRESVEHFLLTCRKFAGIRRDLSKAARANKTPFHQKDLLTTPSAFEALSVFCRMSFRFHRSRYKSIAPPQQIMQSSVPRPKPNRRRPKTAPCRRQTTNRTATRPTPARPPPRLATPPLPDDDESRSHNFFALPSLL
ncbi:uncharacterized protein MELLADRAFT_65107 [Melampsora larici-populina 98AG31]|uniref:Reverse transcriptase zinc-binding domain-containing protein n=1 Tax=Melampsora larici-populina (strain 98AG31 / pathotype 3-4-7) TaxID=747676 RepID=F4RU09_MELLP|nr:uncharacterized protein MELLADRAFT_65107 [Melampsora larici-populina 98AG31]EGG04096.1 hypothetical protein MELLADRAFT_65107 [Melampsora larici-populina 98AG31]